MTPHKMLLRTAIFLLALPATRSFTWGTRPRVRDAVGFRWLATPSRNRQGEGLDASPPPPPHRGDPLRESTGIRPSLHPVTINALTKVLVARAKRLSGTPFENDDDNSSARPVDLALYAGRIAADALASRQVTSGEDGMALTPLEQQTVAGRVVGVTVRLATLEDELVRLCAAAPWVAKYRAWDSFGVLGDSGDSKNETADRRAAIHDRIVRDPLFALSRAECLLAVYLSQVEAPELQAKNVTVSGGSDVDFLDEDRRSALLEDR